MRRKDREVKDPARIEEAIAQSEILRVGFLDEGEVYIVPVNFGYSREDGRYTLYFHGASAGRKYELACKGGSVGFEMEAASKLQIQQEVACNSTCHFKSVIGTGRVSLITDPEEKRKGLNQIMRHFTGRDEHTFEEKALTTTAVYRIEVDKLSCKEKA